MDARSILRNSRSVTVHDSAALAMNTVCIYDISADDLMRLAVRSDTDPEPRSRRTEGNPEREQPELGSGDRAAHRTARDKVEARFIFPELVLAGAGWVLWL